MGYERVLQFWFGNLDAHGRASAAHARRWWLKDPTFDAAIREQFGALHQAVVRGEHEAWLGEAHSCLGYVIVLDQFSRNMFRDEPASFAADAQALRAAERGLHADFDELLALDERPFLFMPLMHSETLATQERCVTLFAGLHDSLPADQTEARETYARQLKFAQMHRDVIARFGRFPHRNAILGRTSTPEEQMFLTQPNSSF